MQFWHKFTFHFFCKSSKEQLTIYPPSIILMSITQKQNTALRRCFAALMLFTINVSLTSHSLPQYIIVEIKKQMGYNCRVGVGWLPPTTLFLTKVVGGGKSEHSPDLLGRMVTGNPRI